MFHIDVLVPAGTHTPATLTELARRLAEDLLTDADLVPASRSSVRDWTQVSVVEAAGWYGPRERCVIRTTVPGPWRKEVSATYIARLSAIAADVLPGARVWTRITGVSEGGLGVDGTPMTSTDIAEAMTRPFRESTDRAEVIGSAAPGTAVDPVCGAIVPLDVEGAITLVRDGVTYGFCCGHCRAAWAAETAAAE